MEYPLIENAYKNKGLKRSNLKKNQTNNNKKTQKKKQKQEKVCEDPADICTLVCRNIINLTFDVIATKKYVVPHVSICKQLHFCGKKYI